jgi:hypothetical protein
MARIRVIVEGEEGERCEQVFELQGDLDSLDGIETAVEEFRLQTLPQVEQTLMQKAQARHLEQQKKSLAPGNLAPG